jgi:hypothetical protein
MTEIYVPPPPSLKPRPHPPERTGAHLGPIDCAVLDLDVRDVPYALTSWRESHHQTAHARRMRWSQYKELYGQQFEKLLADPTSVLLGAYRLGPDGPVELLGFLVATRGRRVDVLHWIQTKHRDASGSFLRRRGVARKLFEALAPGERLIYSLRARPNPPDGSFDVTLAKKLADRGVTAVYEPLLELIK